MKSQHLNLKLNILLAAFILLCALGIKAQSSLTFTINNNTGSNSITCSSPAISLSASSNFTGTINYLWMSPSYSTTGANVTLSNPGIYTVVAYSSPTANSAQTLAIGINTTNPSSVLSPTIQNITCNLSSITNVTAVASPSINITHQFLSPFGGAYIASSQIAFYTPGAPGTYTHILIDDINGCSVTKTFTVTSSFGFPTFSLTSSPPNFSLGCNSTSLTTITILNATTNGPGQIPTGGPVSYTILPPFGSIGTQPSYPVTIPGTWTVIVIDNNSTCETKIPITILQNTAGPDVSVNIPTQTLDCNTSQIQLQGSSTVPIVLYAWNLGSASIPGSVLTISANLSAPTSTAMSFTLTVTNSNSTCKSTTIVPIYQNVFPPHAHIGNSANAITCIQPTLVLSNQSSTGIPPSSIFPTNQPVIGETWTGPSPQTPLNLSTTYTASTPGVYTLQAKDLNNGCTSFTTIVVNDNRVFPNVNNPTIPSPFCLTAGQATVTPIITGPTTGFSYTWTIPAGATASGTNSQQLVTDMLGVYTISVTNSTNGCSTTSQMTVIDCINVTGINKNQNSTHAISIFPNPNTGILNIITSDLSKNNSTIEVYNVLGVLVKKENILTGAAALDIRDQANGIYIVRVLENDKTISTARIIKQ